MDIYTHSNADNGNGSQVERIKVTGYLSLFLFINFCGLNRIGFHHIDLKGPSIRILRAISIDWNFLSIIHCCETHEGAHLIPIMLESIKGAHLSLLWDWASFTNSVIFTNNDYL